MSVTAATGFRSAGIAAGLKSNGNRDLAVIVNDGPRADAAAVFTSNRAQAHPVRYSRSALADGQARAIVLNSGGANCFTGAFGQETTELTAAAVAAELQFDPSDVLVCSTGLIGYGRDEFRDAVLAGVPRAVAALSSDDTTAATAILTTDSVAKTAIVHGSGYTIGGIAKGAGMLAPGLATMLVVITTDAQVDAAPLQTALRRAVDRSFNRLDSDGCMSTNDQVTLFANGASGVTADDDEFSSLLTQLCDDLARQMQEDAEGASHHIDIDVIGAKSEPDAVEVGRAVARSNLFKTAIFGKDPNWGRVLAAIGTTSAQFDPYEVSVSFNGVRLCHRGEPDQPPAAVVFEGPRVHVLIDLHAGDASALIRTNDLTTQYVIENSAYSS